MALTETEVKAAYAVAPQNLKDYIDSNEMYDAFYEIRTTHNLHIDHAGNLALAINAVILGMRPFEQLPQLLREGMQSINDETRDKVLKDINDKIFVPLRNMSKKHAEEVVKPKVQARPSVRDIEIKLSASPDAAVPPTPKVPEAPAGSATPAATTTAPTQPLVSVVEQKMSVTNAPPTVQQQVAPAQAPAPTPKYHGSDPYKEPIE